MLRGTSPKKIPRGELNFRLVNRLHGRSMRRAGVKRGRDAILRNRLQKFDKLQCSTLDGVDLYVFGVLHGETIRQTKQRVCLYSLAGTETEARG